MDNVVFGSEFSVDWEEVTRDFVKLSKELDIVLVGFDAVVELPSMVIDRDDLYKELFHENDNARYQARDENFLKPILPCGECFLFASGISMGQLQGG